jgi:hypothetical protein
MSMPRVGKIRRGAGALLVLASLCASVGLGGAAHASATLLLEEPYGKLGFFTATGHAAVYLSGVCAETPVRLRACRPGENGVVISRYDGVAGYDWVAIPLIPYLYAVEKPEDIPLFVDAKTVNFLRDQYRRRHLEAIAPDVANGETPGGNWVQLVGSAYDRTAYAFQIETAAAKDKAFIRAYNAAPNESHFRTVSHNCADFAKDVINFYYPKALHRSVVADVGITTPKQMAKTMIKYSARHPELELTRFVIPQIPGSMARSTKVHGVVESFLKSKKYIVPSAIASPIFAGCVVAVYEGTGAGRFDPAKEALVYNAERDLEPPIGPEDRRAYQLELTHLVAAASAETGEAKVEKWGRLFHETAPDFDNEGRPVLRFRDGEQDASVGIAASNLFADDTESPVTQELLEARLRAELRRGTAPKVSESDVEHDWQRLQKAMKNPESEMAEQARRPLPGGAQAVYVGNRQ